MGGRTWRKKRETEFERNNGQEWEIRVVGSKGIPWDKMCSMTLHGGEGPPL